MASLSIYLLRIRSVVFSIEHQQMSTVALYDASQLVSVEISDPASYANLAMSLRSPNEPRLSTNVDSSLVNTKKVSDSPYFLTIMWARFTILFLVNLLRQIFTVTGSLGLSFESPLMRFSST